MRPSHSAIVPRESAPTTSPIEAKFGPCHGRYRRAWLIGLTILAPILALRLGCDVLESYYIAMGRRIASAVLRPPPIPRPPAAVDDPYETGYALGRREAAEELAKATASLYVAGLRFARSDPDTGLPCKHVAGCVIDASTEGRISGHNDAIREQIKASSLVITPFSPYEGLLVSARAAILIPRWERPPIFLQERRK
jgi:hypothetical protein